MSAMMSSLKLWVYPTVALVIFLAVFSLMLVRVYRRGGEADAERAGHIPLDDEPGTER